MTRVGCGSRSSLRTALFAVMLLVIATDRGIVQNTLADKHTSLDEPFQSSFHNLKHSPCVTLYNRKGRSGCGTADRDASAGPLYYYDGSSSSSPEGDHVAVIEEYQLTSKVINTLVSNGNGNLKGVMVLNGTQADDTNEYASNGPIYPLGYSTPSEGISYGNSAFAWNSKGDGLIQSDLYGVPLVYINEYETSSYIRNAAKDASTANNIFAAFNYYMGPDQITSTECLQWIDASSDKWNPKCLPLGGLSVWGFAGSPPASSSSSNNNNRELSSKNAILFGTSIDSTSMFHDLVPGANEGASNALTLLMAAYLLGQSVDDATLDALNNRIVFGFFEGEAYGYLGSRSFLNDVLNFQCDEQYTVRSVSNNQNSDMACLYPMRPSLKFKDLGSIASVVTVDQVGIPSGDGNLFVHNSGQGGLGTFLASVMKYSGTNSFAVTDSAAGQNADQYPYPPTAVTSMLSITGGNKGGAVLTGYDYSFSKRPPYQSHLNWDQIQEMNLKAIASAATILARTALAAAYDDGSYDYETAAYYAKNKISALSADNEMLLELADCLLVDGNCNLLSKYASMDAANERVRTGFEIGLGSSLGQPPNYYVSVYNSNNGQPFVKVGKDFFGAYNGNKYGKDSKDAIGMQPKMLQQAIRNMLTTFLGKGSMVDSSGNSVSAKSCSSSSDCSGISYCASSDDSAICSAEKVCVCNRAYYHVALDGALTPAPNNMTGFFDLDENDAGLTPVWTEPFWSNVGVSMYHHSESNPGWFVLAGGAATLGVSFFVAILVKVGMKKQKLF
jgi:nicastrin